MTKKKFIILLIFWGVMIIMNSVLYALEVVDNTLSFFLNLAVYIIGIASAIVGKYEANKKLKKNNKSQEELKSNKR